MGAPLSEHAVALGHRIRMVRRARGLTLVEMAARAQLSHPFLSQLERGLAQPSMTSLDRIARALGSSQVELLAGAAARRAPAAPVLVRAGTGERGPYGFGEATMLVRGDTPFTPMLFQGNNTERGEYHRHDEAEFLHVLAGAVTVDLGDVCELTGGDSLYYAGGTPHRWFSPDGAPYQLLVVKQRVAVPEPRDGVGPAPTPALP